MSDGSHRAVPHAVVHGSLSLQQKSLFVFLLFVITFGCLWDFMHGKAVFPVSTWEAVLLTAPQNFIYIVQILKELLLPTGVFKPFSRPVLCILCALCYLTGCFSLGIEWKLLKSCLTLKSSHKETIQIYDCAGMVVNGCDFGNLHQKFLTRPLLN